MENNIQTEETVSEEAVWSVVEFARTMAGMYGQTYLTPDLISARMRDINLNPMAATESELATALTSPKSYEKQLQQYSQSFELNSMIYKRLIAYLANMLSFDITYVSTAESNDYNTPKYKKDLKIVESVLQKFDYKKEFSIVVREMLRNDAYFGCIREIGDSIILQELPPEYCQITGRWENGFLFSFNMYWFLQPGVDINMYPEFFKKKYKEIWESPNTIRNYIPSLPPELRDKSTWVYWVDIPVDIGVCFKLSPELVTRLPYFTPLFSDLVLQSLMRNLQKSASMAAASRMIIGQVPLLNKEIKATVKDTIAISPELLGKFMALVKSALSEAIKMASAPLEDIQGIAFDSENELYSSYLKTTLATSGINTNLIFSNDIKPNVIETQLSLNVDEQMMTSLYDQFNRFMYYFVNTFTKTFKFFFSFEGTDFFLDRDRRLNNAMTLFAQGIVLPQKIAAAIGMKPFELRKHIEEASATQFMQLLTPPMLEQQKTMADISLKQQKEMADINAQNQEKQAEINANNQMKQAEAKQVTPTGQPASKGRPRKKDSELSEDGEQTRTEGTNISRGGKLVGGQ